MQSAQSFIHDVLEFLLYYYVILPQGQESCAAASYSAESLEMNTACIHAFLKGSCVQLLHHYGRIHIVCIVCVFKALLLAGGFGFFKSDHCRKT